MSREGEVDKKMRNNSNEYKSIFAMIEINFIIRKISKAEKLFAPKQQTSGRNTSVIFYFF